STPQTFTYAAGTTSFTRTHKYVDDNLADSYGVSLTLSDNDGGSTSASANVTVTNAPPTLSSVTLTPSVASNGVATLAGIIGDVGSNDTFTLLVDWGDGSAVETVSYPAGTTTFSRTHAYVNPSAADLTCNVGVTLQDDDGGSATAGRSILVTATPKSALSGVTVTSTVDEGGTATLAGTITNPATNPLQLVIDWGDGSAAQSFTLATGATSFSQTHKYLDDGVN